MAYVGVLASAGGLVCLTLFCIVILRFKELRLRRIMSSLEWLATNLPERWRQFDGPSVAEAWRRTQPLFEASVTHYLGLVWNARLYDLYWGNRFGAELQRLSLYPLPQDVQGDAVHQRHQVVLTHIRDLVIIAYRVLQLERIQEDR
jgi:hypothetical protein